MTTWSEAFAAQARSDLDVYDFLTSSTMPISHRLHYLQMWLEKICKAHTPDEEFRKTHNVIAKVLPARSGTTGAVLDLRNRPIWGWFDNCAEK